MICAVRAADSQAARLPGSQAPGQAAFLCLLALSASVLSHLGPSQHLWHQLDILLASLAASRLFLPASPHCSRESGFTPCLLPRRVEEALSGRPMSPSVCPDSVTAFPLTTAPGCCPCRQALSQDRHKSRRVNLSRVHAVLPPHRGK